MCTWLRYTNPRTLHRSAGAAVHCAKKTDLSAIQKHAMIQMSRRYVKVQARSSECMLKVATFMLTTDLVHIDSTI
jgi:hypothetical protein